MVKEVKSNKKEKKFIIGCIIIILLVPVFLLLPWITWELTSFKKLDILVLDKSVPDNTYREHKSLIWLINYFKFSKRILDVKKDYAGTHPVAGKNSFEYKQLSQETITPDIIYLADTYGVYRENNLDRKKLFPGGLQSDELDYILDKIQKGVGLIAEFNSINWPTKVDVRNKLCRELGIVSTGWVGNYYDDLSIASDSIPSWLIKLQKKISGNEWNFKGNGFVFSQDGKKMFVLRNNIELKGNDSLKIIFNDKSRKRFEVSQSIPYPFILEWVKAGKAKTLAEFHFNLTESGRKLLKKFDFPEKFPAVLEYIPEGIAPRFYFAGDFSDQKKSVFFLRLNGIDKLMRIISRSSDFDPIAKFYWNVYTPMLKTIFEEFSIHFKKIRER